jgi:anti-sigma B factor antagonist
VATLTASVTVHDSGAGPYTLLELAGEADIVSSGTLHGVLEAETRKRPGLLVIEMSGLAYMDSAALQAIVRANLALGAEGGRLALVCPRDNVARVLQMTEVDQLVPVYGSLAEAAPRSLPA